MQEISSKKEYDFIKGETLFINKPYSWTSFSVVNSIRYLLKHHYNIKKIKVGHAGTLDPLATGLLIICTGKNTKKIDEYQGLEKEYTGTFTIGVTTPSYDLETEIDYTFPIDHITPELLHKTAESFLGSQLQYPPKFSAIQINGKRAYEYARKNEEVKIKAKTINISEFKITKIDLPKINFKIICSKGTYIRAIARDFGKALNSGAYMSSLVRTRIGKHTLEDAFDLEEIKKILQHQK